MEKMPFSLWKLARRKSVSRSRRRSRPRVKWHELLERRELLTIYTPQISVSPVTGVEGTKFTFSISVKGASPDHITLQTSLGRLEPTFRRLAGKFPVGFGGGRRRWRVDELAG